MKDKIRVKCANCGMVYDIYKTPEWTTDSIKMRGNCPQCGSNAFNKTDDNLQIYR